jgi:hypothetical protein
MPRFHSSHTFREKANSFSQPANATRTAPRRGANRPKKRDPPTDSRSLPDIIQDGRERAGGSWKEMVFILDAEGDSRSITLAV